MKGWSEDEFKNRRLMAPCGLYCGVCGVYIATRDGNEKLKTVMGNLYGTKPEETECLGCMQPNPPKKIYGYCNQCPIRDCIKSKGYYSCHQCTDRNVSMKMRHLSQQFTVASKAHHSSEGLLIQAAVGNAGGAGALRTNLSGCAWAAERRTRSLSFHAACDFP